VLSQRRASRHLEFFILTSLAAGQLLPVYSSNIKTHSIPKTSNRTLRLPIKTILLGSPSKSNIPASHDFSAQEMLADSFSLG
jgi:hypothetical protein